ncbi:beta-ketoacyl-[acyl-carrier-protein] synthase II [bacterium CG2_30_54_10]|nr:MAG: beta-ketoacyl-[acyl-carrier-protein] synthase II [bacterium CG2_30_54_10]
MNRVFVTGLGAVTPIGIGIEEFGRSLRAGKSGVCPISCFDASKHSVRIAGEVKNFDPAPYITKKDIRRHDRYSQFAMAASHMAIQQAGLVPGAYDPKRVGVIISTGIGGIHTYEEEFKVISQQGPRRVSPFLVPMMICNIAAGYVAIAHGFKGPNFCIVSACASGLHGIGEGYLKLVHGMIDICVTGGSEAAIISLNIAGFAQMKALSTRNDAPEKASRPFDKDRDGFVMGEGAGVLILETEASMNRRGAKPLAEVIGYGASADAHHLTAPCPDGEGAYQAMTDALEFSKTPKESVNYVNAHGTSTHLGDVAETIALKRVFGDHAKKLMVNSTKSMIGHLLGAAGTVGAVATVIQMTGGFVHPTINLDCPGEGLDLDYVPNTARNAQIEAGLVNSFGFGGQNACVVFRKA